VNRESQRAQAVPRAISETLPRGCAFALAGYLAACLWLFVLFRHWVWAFLAVPALVGAGAWIRHYLIGQHLLRAVQNEWYPRGIRCLIVHSDSPVWREHIESHWLPRFGHVAFTLNWSERARWERALAVRVFDHFCGRHRNFNPAVVVFRGMDRPLVFRFFRAFKQAKHGSTEYVAILEQQMLAALGLAEVGDTTA
jgi:hypothetical protein